MNAPTESNPRDGGSAGFSARRNRGPGKRSATGIALACAAAAYAFLSPIANERFGWNLPQFNERDGRQSTAQTTSPRNLDESTRAVATKRPGASGTTSTSDQRSKSSSSSTNASANEDRFKPSGGNAASAASNASTPTNASSAKTANAGLRYGLLRDLGGERYLSPAGLMYTRGSAEGHRLKHLERHTADQPRRPGSHGVFDGGMKGALETIDKAYERAKKKQRTTVKQDRDRTIYTVDMGSRVGYVGGQTGGRKRKPMARRVQLVLEGTRVITAYPK
ncbi:MAG: hypothetical protein AAF989_04420 [Planctomycetota bacterium]